MTAAPRLTLLLLLAGCTAPDAEVAPAWSSTLSPRVESTARAFDASGAGWASVVGAGLPVRLDADGLRASSLHLRTHRWGRAGALEERSATLPVEGARVEGTEVARVELRGAGLTEWWLAAGAELEQGWDVPRAPEGQGPLVIDVAVDGARIEAGADDTSVRLREPSGRVWTYGRAAAWDADGDALPTRLVPDGGRVRVVVDDTDADYPILVDPVLSTPTATFDGEQALTAFGFSVDNAGDVDGNGYPDVIVGAYRTDSYTGRVFVYGGSAAGLPPFPDQTIDPDVTSAFFGEAVAGIGDINGDGYADVAIAAPGYATFTGRVYVYLGSAGGLTGPIATLDGEAAPNYFGAAIDDLGDVDGDGYDDFAVGAYGYDDYRGRVYVYPGSADGPDLSRMVTFDGEDTYNYYGRAIAGGGDPDGDGSPDLIVTAERYEDYTGRLYLYPGTGSGISTTPRVTLTGATTNAYFGSSVDVAGDINGDGREDVLVGAYEYDAGRGEAYVFDGIGRGLGETPSWTVTGGEIDDLYGGTVAAAGDIDADGYADVAVSATGFENYTGRVYVYEGGPKGLDTDPASTLTGEGNAHYFGTSIAGAGDVEGDGYDDLLVGAYNVDTMQGRVYLFSGIRDDDGDGASASADCDDTNPFVYPGAVELVGDGVDSDCDGTEICYVDGDDDDFRPDATSTTSSTDADCDDAGEAPPGALGGDCDDGDPGRNPGATEGVADGVDQDCDGRETCWIDVDGDGYWGTHTGRSMDFTCSSEGFLDNSDPGGDCDDDDATRYPGADDAPGDGIDGNCDGVETCYVDGDGDGWRVEGSGTVESDDGDCFDLGEGVESDPVGDCDDSDARFNPGALEDDCADPNDYNCDGAVAFVDSDGDGGADCVDCAPSDPSVYPGAPELCNDADDDCDGAVDSPLPDDGPRWFPDEDGDGYGGRAVGVLACEAPAGLVGGGDWDCDDGDAGVNPGAEDKPGDGIDQNCNGKDDVKGGCGCASTDPGAPASLAVGLLAALLVRRRRA